MSDFADSYLGGLRRLVGSRLLLVPGTRVVVTDAVDRILLEQRSDFRLWGLPGGVPDAGEDITACAIREVREETGLRIRDPVPFGFASAPEHETWAYPNGDRCHYFTLLYAARAEPGPLRVPGGENLDLAWFDAQDLPDLLPVMARTLAAYRRWRETSAFQML
ncbi:NUDIX domain-containing protein [Methylobacterium radiodurans]|uniref:NUDIX hydrolase n=1 Tax=Methylobacterium radiodurans TaxID=2202828 RepID=A0A2U8VW36_9HYPH|nr:NUDIX domain-containing protein [Methylobacterium radiodurans]AWN37432.1 NUDIX hydrolase [Methylobacterium radiodurans]